MLNDKCEDQVHELWLIYCQLKDAEIDLLAREQLISSARGPLGNVVNSLHRVRLEPKSPGRLKALTPNTAQCE